MSRIAVAAALLVIGCSASTFVAYAEPGPSPSPSPSPTPSTHGGGAAPGPAAAGPAAPGPATPGPATPGPEAPGPPPGPLTSFGDGTYQVGTQVMPGVYQSAGPVEGGTCYWKRANDNGIVANAMSKKPQTVQIQAGDTTFKTSECQDWQKTDAPPPAQPSPADLLGPLGSLIGVGAAQSGIGGIGGIGGAAGGGGAAPGGGG